jgi:protein TonB
MEKSYFLSMTFNNIVIKGRNKAYGAYTLRRAYSKHMLLAATLATALFSGALVGPLVETMFFADPVKYKKPTHSIVEPYIIKLPQPPTPEPAKTVTPAPATEKKVATEKYTSLKVVDDATPATEAIPNKEDMAKVNIGTEKIEGELPEMPTVSFSEEPPTGIENGSRKDMAAPPSEYIHVEQMPEFKGGTDALGAYLGRKITLPS